MNNDTTGMTGGQEHAGTGRTARGAEAPRLDIAKLCQAIGAKRVREIDAYKIKDLEKIMKEELAEKGPSVLISNQPCVLRYRVTKKAYAVERKTCSGLQAVPQGGVHRPVLYARGQDGFRGDRSAPVQRLRGLRPALYDGIDEDENDVDADYARYGDAEMSEQR